jgi:hypothetical protein
MNFYDVLDKLRLETTKEADLIFINQRWSLFF